ncbi:hypothetical protein M0802_005810 [Mischocyttarus mexicanus]|nr:hypothetical protein M0802_005810 [Mischocyttarus mexicanus]
MARLSFKFLELLATYCFLFNYCLAIDTKELKIRMLPVYGILKHSNVLNSTQCGEELRILREAIDKRLLWGLKVIDSSGGPRSEFIYGNNYWLGSRSQCEDVGNKDPFPLSENIFRNNTEDEFPPYEVKYFVADLRHNSTFQYHITLPQKDFILLGMCLPASCSKDQIEILLETVLTNTTIHEDELYLFDFKLMEVRDLIDDHQWLFNGKFITLIIIIVLTLLLMILGTAYDVFVHQKRLKKLDESIKYNVNINIHNKDEVQKISENNENNENQLEKSKSQSLIFKIFQAFSVYSNTKILFNSKMQETSMPVIYGLRFFSMMWVIMVHISMYSLDFYDNMLSIWRLSEGLLAQIIFNGTLSVDTFLCFGGFLVAYLYFKTKFPNNKPQASNYLNIIQLYFLNILKRYIRLTPMWMIIIGLLEINTTWHSKNSVFYISERQQDTCRKYWWRNILYIQNLFSAEDMCMNWGWYLANDMQYFVIVTFLLFLSSMYFKVAASLLGLLFTSSIILTGYMAYIYNYAPTLDKEFTLAKELYYSPWTRIGPYLVGVIAGYIVVKLNNKLLWKKETLILFWIVGSLCNLLVLFGLYQKRMSVLSRAIYTALGRNVWAIGIAWVIIACCTDNGGIVKRILSLKIWVPLSRLTYAAYLLNPLIIVSINLLRETSVHFNSLESIILGLGYIVITYICSYVVSLMFEMPYVYLIKEGFNSLSTKK